MRSRDTIGLLLTVIVGGALCTWLIWLGMPRWIAYAIAFAIGWFGSVASRNLGSGS